MKLLAILILCLIASLFERDNGMSHAGIGIALGIASLAAGVGSSIAQGRAARRAADSQEAAAERSGEAGAAFTSRQLSLLGDLASDQQGDINRFAGSFRRTDNATEFIQDAININQQGFDFQTGLKRENLEFILGESFSDLRRAQGRFYRTRCR